MVFDSLTEITTARKLAKELLGQVPALMRDSQILLLQGLKAMNKLEGCPEEKANRG